MKAIVITRPGGPEVLHLEDRPKPEPVADQVRVKIHFAGLNRADLMQREGKYPAPPGAPADIPGIEIMGTVEAIGPLVTTWKVGQRVFGLLGGGGYAEFALTNERLLAPVPDNLPDEAAGAVPEAFMTAHDALFSQAGVVPGEHVLIHAIGSGVATAALQLAKAIGCTTYGTARSPDKLERAKELGLDVALPLPDFASALHDETGGKGVNIVLDFVGAPYFEANLQALTTLGRLVQIGTMAGNAAQLNLGLLMQKRLRLMGTMLRARPLEEKAFVTRRFAEQVVPLLEQGKVRPIVDKVFRLEEAAQAHTYLEGNSSFGKVLLKMGGR